MVEEGEKDISNKTEEMAVITLLRRCALLILILSSQAVKCKACSYEEVRRGFGLTMSRLNSFLSVRVEGLFVGIGAWEHRYLLLSFTHKTTS